MANLFHQIIYLATYPLRALAYSPGKLFAPFRKLAGLSLPAKVAILSFFFLVTCVVVLFVVDWQDPDRAAWDLFKRLWWAIAILLLVIPFVIYYALRAWLEGEISPFPDVDRAWKAGLAELEQQGLDLSQVPLFLILGSAGEGQERSLLEASGLDLNVREVPSGPAALHWYANPDGVYLVCTRAGCLSKLSAIAREVIQAETVAPGPPGAPSPRPPAEPFRGTIVAGQEDAPPEPQPDDEEEDRPGAVPSSVRGTMMVFGDAAEPSGSDEPVPIKDAADKRVIKLGPQEEIEQALRLKYLCRLIRRARQPLCPANGILTLLPFGLIQRSTPEAIEVQRAAKKDLSTVDQALMLRCPVTALVVGMEEESGFRELVRRVGRERAAGQRFGKGYAVSNPPLPERMKALCAHACGSFEDWVYALFREKGALAKTTNTELYSLLVKVRQRVHRRLANVLAMGYGLAEEQDRQGEGPLFSGCYFAATGDADDRRAFVKNVFDKLPEEQEELQWTQAALEQDAKLQQTAHLVLAYCTVLVLALVGMIVHNYWW